MCRIDMQTSSRRIVRGDAECIFLYFEKEC